MEKDKDLNFHNLFYIFLTGCIVGHIIEGLWTLIKSGKLYNHSALVIGPFNIIYGMGAVALTIFLSKYAKKNKLSIFTSSIIMGTVLEYIASFFMEKLFGYVAWDYSKVPFNINGRVCLLYSVFWGFVGLLWMKKIYPKLTNLINNLDHEKSTRFMYVTILFLIFDAFLTYGAFNRAYDAEKGIPPENKVEEMYDKYFSKDYLINMTNNRWHEK